MKEADFLNRLDLFFDIDSNRPIFNILCTNIEKDNRRSEFFNLLSSKKLKEFENDGDYDYVVIRTINSPADIYSVYKKHNKKIVIFDTDKIFSRKQYRDVTQSGFRSSPDSGHKAQVYYLGFKEFTFKGIVIILTSYSKAEILSQEEKYSIFIRDMILL